MANPFDSRAMAAGYANARPPVHPRVIELARPYLEPPDGIARALDIGCGAGLSTRALLPLARQVFGLEPSEGMMQWTAAIAPAAHFVVGMAEALPFPDHCMDLIAAAGALNYVALDQFFPEAARVLSPAGRLLVYDFSPGRNFPADDTLDAWFATFLSRYPTPVSHRRPLDPAILRALDPRFELRHGRTFEVVLPLTPEFYLEYVLTGTNVADAVRRGVAEDDVRAWCAETLRPVWQGQVRDVVFHGYFACLAPVGGSR